MCSNLLNTAMVKQVWHPNERSLPHVEATSSSNFVFSSSFYSCRLGDFYNSAHYSKAFYYFCLLLVYMKTGIQVAKQGHPVIEREGGDRE